MNNSNLSSATFKPGDNYSWPHSRVEGKVQPIDFVNLDNAGPAGAINSSAADMAKWVLLQLNHGKFLDRDGRLFSEKQSQEMWSPQTILTESPYSPVQGWGAGGRFS
jgi:CubicO group peptidase (beta-lactamase class C family)